MSKKRKIEKNGDIRTGSERAPMPGGGMEKMMSDLSRLLDEHEFATIDEANAFLEELIGSGQPIPSREPETPLEQAQELIYKARETGNRRRRIKLAKEALTISEDCADAYVILAEESARSLEQAKELYEAGVQAGERALGPEFLEEEQGHFWGMIETRPYMRARLGLASVLWELGQRREAIEHYQNMLRLNPSDNQGVRHILLPCLIAEGMDTETERLLRAYDEASAMWFYTHALFMFRQHGATRKTKKQLIEAMTYNPHVPDYLLGRKRLPKSLPPYIGLGDDSEAAYYAAETSHLWRQEPGALDWLRETWAEMP